MATIQEKIAERLKSGQAQGDIFKNLTEGEKGEALTAGLFSIPGAPAGFKFDPQSGFSVQGQVKLFNEKQAKKPRKRAPDQSRPSTFERGVAFTQPGGQTSKKRQLTGPIDITQAELLAAQGGTRTQGETTADTIARLKRERADIRGAGNIARKDPFNVELSKAVAEPGISDLFVGKGTPGGGTSFDFAPGAQKVIEEATATEREKLEAQKRMGEATERGLISGRGITDVEGLTDKLPTGIPGQMLEETTDIIDKQAEINKSKLNLDLFNQEKQVVWKDGLPTALTPAAEELINKQYSTQLDLAEQMKADQIAQKQMERTRFENEMGRNITLAENQAIEEELRLRSMAQVNGWAYNSATFAQNKSKITKTNDTLNYMKTTKAQESAFMGDQISRISQMYNTKIADIVNQREEKKMEKYEDTVNKINKINNDILMNDLEKEEKTMLAKRQYVEDYYRGLEEERKQIEFESKQVEDDVNWFDQREEMNIFGDQNWRDNGDGTVTMAWLNKNTGQIETTTQDIGITGFDTGVTGELSPFVQIAVDTSEDTTDLVRNLALAGIEEGSPEARQALQAFSQKTGELAGLSPAIQDLNLQAASSGKLTKASLGNLMDEAKESGDEEYIKRLGTAIASRENEAISPSQADKFSTPTGITKGQFDEIIRKREEAGFGNKEFQRIDLKTINKEVVPMLDLEQDLRSIRAIKEGWEYVQTLSPEEQARITGDFDFINEDYDGVNTGPIAGRAIATRQAFDVGDPETNLRALDNINNIAGKYTVEFMKEASGVAISELEAKRLQRLLPNIKQEDQAFLDKLSEAQGDLADKVSANTAKFGIRNTDELRNLINNRKSGLFNEIADQVLSDLEKESITTGVIGKEEPAQASFNNIRQEFGIQDATDNQIQQLIDEGLIPRDFLGKAPDGKGAKIEGNNQAPLPPPPTAQKTVTLPNGVPVSEGKDFVKILVKAGSRMARDFLQCGSFVNMIAGGALWIGDTIAEKRAKIASKIPQVGSVAVFDRNNPYGHVSLVERVFTAGGKPAIQIVESNNRSDGKVGRRLLTWNGKNWIDNKGKVETLEGFSESFKKLPSQRRLARFT